MRRRILRLQSLFAAAVLLFGNGRAALGPVDCPQHGVAKTAEAKAVPAHASHGAHASHAAAAAPDTQKSQHDHSGCTCLEHCQSCQVTGMPAVAVRLPESQLLPVVATPAPAALARIPARAPHQLPFATAPPSVV